MGEEVAPGPDAGRGAGRREDRGVPVAGGGGGPIDPEAGALSPAEAEACRAAFRSILRGRAPGPAELARATGLPERTVREAVAGLARSGRAVVDAAGRVVGSAGLSLVPSPHRLLLGGEAFHTWCAVDAVGIPAALRADAVGIPAALRADAVARTACPTCGRAIEVRFREGRSSGGQGLRAWLPTRGCCTSLVDELCPDMNLFCSEEHLEEWRRGRGDPPGLALTLEEAEELGWRWWGDLA
ncbi:MAG TPA: organomercurial lyase [Actinomycetota bacterium]|nr:organomercurial lyase [Actinomycetota bacterium]